MRRKLPVALVGWTIPEQIDLALGSDDPADWRAHWHPQGHQRRAGRRESSVLLDPSGILDPSRLLDAFVALGRPVPHLRWTRRAVERFVDHWGTWTWCERGDLHPPFAPDMPDAEGRDWSRMPIVDDRGVPIGRVDDARMEEGVLVVCRRYRIVATDDRDHVGEMMESARRVNALRRAAISLRDSRPAPHDDWLAVWPLSTRDHDRWGSGWPPDRPPIQTVDQQRDVLDRTVDRWLRALHVRPVIGPVAGGSVPLFYAGSVSGALALAFAVEAWVRVTAAACIECGTTWRPERRAPGAVGLCTACLARMRGQDFRSAHPRDRSRYADKRSRPKQVRQEVGDGSTRPA